MNTPQQEKAAINWKPIDMNDLPPELLIVKWKHPEYGIITGSLVKYHATYKDGDNTDSYWVFPDPDTEGHSADIWLGEFTEVGRINRLVTP